MSLKTIVFALFVLFTTNLQAEMGMVTGSDTGTYIQFGKDIAAISHHSGLNIKVKASKGSIDNIRRMSSKENAAFAIVQSDVLGFLSKSKESLFNQHAKRLRLIYPFYLEEVHLFARKEIKSLHDLQGKTVIVGPKSSGSNMTAWNILKMLNIEPAKRLNKRIDEGIAMVLSGTADAVFIVAGKPRNGFSNLFSTSKSSVKKLLQQVHFVPLDDPALFAEYEKSNLSDQDYSFIEGSIPTVAVKALLVSYDFSSGRSAYYKKRCHQLRTVSQVIRQNIATLRKDHHKKWNQVNLDGDMSGWPKDKCAHSHQPAPQKSQKIKQENKPSIILDIKCTLNRTC